MIMVELNASDMLFTIVSHSGPLVNLDLLQCLAGIFFRYSYAPSLVALISSITSLNALSYVSFAAFHISSFNFLLGYFFLKLL